MIEKLIEICGYIFCVWLLCRVFRILKMLFENFRNTFHEREKAQRHARRHAQRVTVNAQAMQRQLPDRVQSRKRENVCQFKDNLLQINMI